METRILKSKKGSDYNTRWNPLCLKPLFHRQYCNLTPYWKGNRAGFWAVTIQANWRVIFKFEDGDVYVVDYLDYH
jgi:hypothetical protein